METKNVIYELRTGKGMSQDDDYIVIIFKGFIGEQS